MVLTTVVTVDPIYVYFNIDEPALLRYVDRKWQSGEAAHPSRIKDQNIPVEIALAKEDGFPHKGILDFIDNKVDPKTGTIRARGNFDNSKQYLTPGLFVRVRIPFGKPRQALLISERAIGTDQRQKYLLTVNKENVVEYRRVKVGSLQNGLRVIESGIRARRPSDRQRIAACPPRQQSNRIRTRRASRRPRRPMAETEKAGTGKRRQTSETGKRCFHISSSIAPSFPRCRR